MCDETKEIKQTRHPGCVICLKPREAGRGWSISNVHSFNFVLLFLPNLVVIMSQVGLNARLPEKQAKNPSYWWKLGHLAAFSCQSSGVWLWFAIFYCKFYFPGEGQGKKTAHGRDHCITQNGKLNIIQKKKVLAFPLWCAFDHQEKSWYEGERRWFICAPHVAVSASPCHQGTNCDGKWGRKKKNVGSVTEHCDIPCHRHGLQRVSRKAWQVSELRATQGIFKVWNVRTKCRTVWAALE